MENYNFNEPPKKKKKNKGKIILIILILLILAVIGAGFILFLHYYGMTNYQPDPESIDIADLTLETLDPDIEEALRKKIDEEQDGSLFSDKNVYNLLLVGVDRDDRTWNGNSDTMILCSINAKKKTVMLTSFMRDTLTNIPVAGLRKMNASFALGGAPLLVQTMEKNFGIDVDNYAWVDFENMEKILEVVGGVDLRLTVKEADYCGIKIDKDQVVSLTAKQAMHHLRDRSSGGNDYGRTQRQRNVMIAIINKAKNGSLGDLSEFAETVLPEITHNIEKGDLLSLLSELLNIREYVVSEQRIPYDKMYHSEGEFLVPDYAETNARLRESIYGESGETESK